MENVQQGEADVYVENGKNKKKHDMHNHDVNINQTNNEDSNSYTPDSNDQLHKTINRTDGSNDVDQCRDNVQK